MTCGRRRRGRGRGRARPCRQAVKPVGWRGQSRRRAEGRTRAEREREGGSERARERGETGGGEGGETRNVIARRTYPSRERDMGREEERTRSRAGKDGGATVRRLIRDLHLPQKYATLLINNGVDDARILTDRQNNCAVGIERGRSCSTSDRSYGMNTFSDKELVRIGIRKLGPRRKIMNAKAMLGESGGIKVSVLEENFQIRENKGESGTNGELNCKTGCRNSSHQGPEPRSVENGQFLTRAQERIQAQVSLDSGTCISKMGHAITDKSDGKPIKLKQTRIKPVTGLGKYVGVDETNEMKQKGKSKAGSIHSKEVGCGQSSISNNKSMDITHNSDLQNRKVIRKKRKLISSNLPTGSESTIARDIVRFLLICQ